MAVLMGLGLLFYILLGFRNTYIDKDHIVTPCVICCYPWDRQEHAHVKNAVILHNVPQRPRSWSPHPNPKGARTQIMVLYGTNTIHIIICGPEKPMIWVLGPLG